jgi:hypothetical protein
LNWVKNTFSDVLKCICIGYLIAIGIGIVTGLIAIISSGGMLVHNFIDLEGYFSKIIINIDSIKLTAFAVFILLNNISV